MRTLKRNESPFYYALYEGKHSVMDERGNMTGEYEVSFGNPIKAMANISGAKGETELRQFGENVAYDKVIVIEDTSSLIDEYSVLWVDCVPNIEEDGGTDTPYDYVVKKVAKSLNSTSIAIEKVSVS